MRGHAPDLVAHVAASLLAGHREVHDPASIMAAVKTARAILDETHGVPVEEPAPPDPAA